MNNYMFDFKQAHNDRLEDAGIKSYGRPVTEGYVIEIEKKSVAQVVANQVQVVTSLITNMIAR